MPIGARLGGIGQAHVRWNRCAWETLLPIVELERSLSLKIAPTDSAEVSHKSCKSLGVASGSAVASGWDDQPRDLTELPVGFAAEPALGAFPPV
jgi:hypothetical protein